MNAGAYVTGTQLRKLGNITQRRFMTTTGWILTSSSGPPYKGIPLSVATTMAISELYGKDIRYSLQPEGK